MDRAAVGLGAVFLHLAAEMNFYQIFNEVIDDFKLEETAQRQREAFAVAGVPLPAGDAGEIAGKAISRRGPGRFL